MREGTIHLTQEQAEVLLPVWQKILRVSDWKVKVRIARGNGLEIDTHTQGTCEWVNTKKQGYIKLLDPIDWDHTLAYPQDMEVTLVHELLHLLFQPFDTFEGGTPQHNAMEQAIDILSYSLVGLRRAQA